MTIMMVPTPIGPPKIKESVKTATENKVLDVERIILNVTSRRRVIPFGGAGENFTYK